jgi:hypothetical protein
MNYDAIFSAVLQEAMDYHGSYPEEDDFDFDEEDDDDK